MDEVSADYSGMWLVRFLLLGQTEASLTLPGVELPTGNRAGELYVRLAICLVTVQNEV